MTTLKASFREPVNVLLVEDDIIVAKVTERLLTRFNCVVDIAATANNALAKAQQNPYQLIFMDIGLPDGNGNDVTASIRKDPTCLNQLTPIVALTAHVDNERKKEGLRVGMNALLAKPISTEMVANILEIFAFARKEAKQ